MKPENIKTVEIRDRATCIPAFAIKMIASDEKELFLFKHCGYRSINDACILLVSIEAPWHSARHWDEWQNRSGRTMPIAHKWIEENFDTIKTGDVIDVEFILNEVENPCQPMVIEAFNDFINDVAKEKENDIHDAT